jgi:ABC-2 type transport system permease protein
MISWRKVWTVAATEFQHAVRSKAFIIGVLLMPALAGISAIVPKFAGDEIDKLERHVAVVDETGRLYPMLSLVGDQWNAAQLNKDGSVKGPRFRLQEVKVAAGRQPDDVRVELSDRVRAKEIFAFVELPKALFEDSPKLRYYTDSPTFQPLPRWLEEVVGRLVIAERLRNTNVDPQTMLALVREMQLDRLGLLTRASDGRIAPARVSDPIRSFVTPLVLMMLMFLIVISTASPLLNSVMEEKMTRISEVLLGSLSPFELMAGKLLGVIGVSMVLSALYLSGAYGFAVYHGYGDAVTAGQIVWFVVYLILAMMIYGSLFIAIGAAASDLKDAQALMTPGMLLFMAPIFIWMPVVRAPGSTMAIVASLVPFATPVLMTLRMALTPAPTVWQIALGFVLTTATSAFFVWAGGRIFRVGILMQGKSATFTEMWRWVRAG